MTDDTPSERNEAALEATDYYLECDYCPPVGGFPQANPDGTVVAPTSRAQSVPTSSAAREMGAYSEHDYDESVLQSNKGRRPARKVQRGRTQKLGGAYGNARKVKPSDADKFAAFDETA